MRFHLCIVAALSLAAQPAAAGLAVNGGSLRLDGGTIRTDALGIGAGAALAGNGTLDAPATDLQGTTAPGGEIPAETGTLVFTGSVRFDGAYLCNVNGHEDVDRITAAGLVSGAAEIAVQKDPAAIPLGQVVLAGREGSDVSAFALAPAQQSDFRLDEPAPGSLALTDLVGDSDGDALPDWWEYAYYTNRTLALPDGDDDEDRSSNLHELGAGTHPRDPESVFAIVHVDAEGGHRLFWNSVAGKTYAIHAASIPDGDYEEFAAGIGAEPPINRWTNEAPGSSPLFYQVRIAP
ncbi:MAG: hypothetical protein EOM72_01385 [Opitutae bacterium]|nr:hypothetical protein [Opitutae bacterium]